MTNDQLIELIKKKGSLRLGQLLWNVLALSLKDYGYLTDNDANNQVAHKLWMIEDEDLIKVLENFYARKN